MTEGLNISYRPMSALDVGRVPISHQGDEAEVLDRIADIGSSAWLAFDGARHIGQLQLRRFVPGTVSPNGVWDPLWWMDFANHVPAVDAGALAVCCCHVGQLDETANRDETYFGHGVGAALLDHFLEWSRENAVPAVVAKTTPGIRSVMEFLGGFPADVYRARGFEVVATWVDHELAAVVRERGLAARGSRAATVGCCVLRLRPVTHTKRCQALQHRDQPPIGMPPTPSPGSPVTPEPFSSRVRRPQPSTPCAWRRRSGSQLDS